MKLTALLFLSFSVTVFAEGLSQTVTFSGKNVSLETIFSAVEKQTGFVVFYDVRQISGAKSVSIDVHNEPLSSFLKSCLVNQPFSFFIEDKTILVGKLSSAGPSDRPSLLVNPPIDVKGRVVDENGQPLSGVNVVVKGTNKGTTTNLKGEFELKDVSENSVLLISSVGYDRQEVLVKNKTFISTQLRVAVGNLDELQVIAYGITSKRLSTGNVTSVKANDIEKQPVNNPLLALQGRVPGLFIIQQSGITGGPINLRIQGVNSIAKGNDPLVIIDGVPYPTSMPRTGLEGSALASNLSDNPSPSPLNFINPLDIESIDVLKDADATAIYGSRAANGAILITTKKAKVGVSKITMNIRQGWGKVTRMLDMMNTRQYLDMRYEAIGNDGTTINTNSDYDLTLWDTTRYTDWQKVLIGNTSQYTNINAGVSGGTSAIQYLVSGTYQRQTTVFPGNFEDKRGSLHFNINSLSSSQKFRMQLSGNYMVDDNRLPNVDLTQQSIWLEPVAPPLYDSEGKLNWALNALGNSTWDNPLVPVLYNKYKNRTNNLVSNLILSYTVLPKLELKSSFGYTNMQTSDYSSVPLEAIKPENRATTLRTAQYGQRILNSWVIEPQVSYKNFISKGQLECLLGNTIQQNKNDARSISGSGYLSDEALNNPGAAATTRATSPTYSLYKYNGLFARINYNWLNKYIVNATARRDGSSRFGSKNQFHNFGSVAAAWIFSEELFAKQFISFISYGKLKASYGTTGNDQLGDYTFLSLYRNTLSAITYQNSPGLVPNGLSNPYLEWEETKKIQLGMELGFFNERVLMNVIYAQNRSSNQLISLALPSITGFISIPDNFPATVQNINWEFSLNTVNVRGKDINWTSSVNFTIPRNKLIAFPNLETSSYRFNLIVGKPLGIIQAYKYFDVDPNTGQYRLADQHGDPTLNPDFLSDRTKLIKTLPSFYGGFQNSITYKGFNVDFIFQFVKQIGTPIHFNNGSAIRPGQFSSGASNQPASLNGRWQKPGDIVDIQRFSTFLDITVLNSDAGYSDASYLRLKNLSISWQLPFQLLKKISLQNSKLYLQGQNLLTITNYKGMDPENQGYTALPPLRMLVMGLQIGF